MTESAALSDDEVREFQALLADERAIAAQERRVAPRHPYPSFQVVTPVLAGGRVDRPSVRRVLCHDISTSGISFLWPAPVDFPEANIALEARAETVSLRARVVWSRSLGNGGAGFLVGCRFLRRLPAE